MNDMIELHVPDFAPARAFYGHLGFKIEWETPPDGASNGYLVMSWQGQVLRFWCGCDAVHDHTYFHNFPATTQPGYGVEIILTCDDVQAVYNNLQNDPCIVETLKTKPWGLRDFRIKDPYGFYLRITERHDITKQKN